MAGILQMTFSNVFSCIKITGCWTGNKPSVYVIRPQCVYEKGTSKRMSAPIFFMSISSEERAFSGVVRLRLWHHFWSCDFPLHIWSHFWSYDFLVTALPRMTESSKVVSPEVMQPQLMPESPRSVKQPLYITPVTHTAGIPSSPPMIIKQSFCMIWAPMSETLCLTHLPPVLHICVSESGQHWFRLWLGTEKCWVIVNENASENIFCQKVAIFSRGDELRC